MRVFVSSHYLSPFHLSIHCILTTGDSFTLIHPSSLLFYVFAFSSQRSPLRFRIFVVPSLAASLPVVTRIREEEKTFGSLVRPGYLQGELWPAFASCRHLRLKCTPTEWIWLLHRRWIVPIWFASFALTARMVMIMWLKTWFACRNDWSGVS